MYTIWYGKTYNIEEMFTINYISGVYSKEMGNVATCTLQLYFTPRTKYKIRILNTEKGKWEFCGEYAGANESISSGTVSNSYTFAGITKILKGKFKEPQQKATIKDIGSAYNQYGLKKITSHVGDTRTVDIDAQTDLYQASLLCADNVEIEPNNTDTECTLISKNILNCKLVEINKKNIINMQKSSSTLDSWNVLVPIGENVDDNPITLKGYTKNPIYKNIGIATRDLGENEPTYNLIKFSDVYNQDDLYAQATAYVKALDENIGEESTITLTVANEHIEIGDNIICKNEDGTDLINDAVKSITQNLLTPNVLSISLGKLQSLQKTITESIENVKVDIKETVAGKFDEIEVKKADIDFANIVSLKTVTAIVEKLLKAGEIITDKVESVEGHFTNYLTGVRIVGDLIEANTLKANALILLGTDGFYYQLNANSLGIETVKLDEEKYSKALDGSVIVEKSITAQKIVVKDLVAFGATIGGFQITDSSIGSIDGQTVWSKDGSFKSPHLEWDKNGNAKMSGVEILTESDNSSISLKDGCLLIKDKKSGKTQAMFDSNLAKTTEMQVRNIYLSQGDNVDFLFLDSFDVAYPIFDVYLLHHGIHYYAKFVNNVATPTIEFNDKVKFLQRIVGEMSGSCLGIGSHIYPKDENGNMADDKYWLGHSSSRWRRMYCNNGYVGSGTAVTSDRNLKHNIRFPTEKYLEIWDKLEPKLFEYNNGTSGRTHLGYIAQDVEEAIKSVGLTNLDLGAVIKDVPEGADQKADGEYSLRYDELFMLSQLKIKQLENKLEEQQKRLEILERKMEKL